MNNYTKIIDTHAHYESRDYDTDRDELLNMIHEDNIDIIVNISSSLDTLDKSLKLTRDYPFIYTSAGLHPDNASELNDSNFSRVSELAKDEKCVVIGEIGLDYYWNKSSKDVQIHWFKRQIELALSLNMPINIHSRDAAKDTYDVLHMYYPDKVSDASHIPGVFHCFSYSPELAAEAVKMGFMLGIGGVVTFKNAKKLIQSVEETPIENLVLETDAPYLAPEPYRGKRNNSGYLSYVAARVAEIKGIDIEEVINKTTENALKLYPKLMRRNGE